jgi:hypothetical protein
MKMARVKIFLSFSSDNFTLKNHKGKSSICGEGFEIKSAQDKVRLGLPILPNGKPYRKFPCYIGFVVI